MGRSDGGREVRGEDGDCLQVRCHGGGDSCSGLARCCDMSAYATADRGADEDHDEEGKEGECCGGAPKDASVACWVKRLLGRGDFFVVGRDGLGGGGRPGVGDRVFWLLEVKLRSFKSAAIIVSSCVGGIVGLVLCCGRCVMRRMIWIIVHVSMWAV